MSSPTDLLTFKVMCGDSERRHVIVGAFSGWMTFEKFADMMRREYGIPTNHKLALFYTNKKNKEKLITSNADLDKACREMTRKYTSVTVMTDFVVNKLCKLIHGDILGKLDELMLNTNFLVQKVPDMEGQIDDLQQAVDSLIDPVTDEVIDSVDTESTTTKHIIVQGGQDPNTSRASNEVRNNEYNENEASNNEYIDDEASNNEFDDEASNNEYIDDEASNNDYTGDEASNCSEDTTIYDSSRLFST